MNARFERFCAYSLQRLKEPSTWAGFTTIVTGFGVSIAPERMSAIITAGTMIAGLLLTFSRDPANTPTNPNLTSTLRGSMPESPPKPIVPPPATLAEAGRVADEAVRLAAAAQEAAEKVELPPK